MVVKQENFYLTMIKKSIISFNSNENSTVDVAQLVESRIVAPVVAGSSPVIHPFTYYADVAELVDALDLGSSVFGVGVRVPSSAYTI